MPIGVYKRTEQMKKNIGLASKGRTPWNKGKKVKECGPLHPRWTGGRRKHSAGYVEAYAPGHPSSVRNFVLEHRLIMEKQIGRYLHTWEIVHHVNGIKTDNRIENLELTNRVEHARLHKEQEYANKR
jgi:hypothetical protein